MWFKNLKVFRLSAHWSKHWPEIEAALQTCQHTPASSTAGVSIGWVTPREDDGRLAVPVAGQILMALRIEKKILPAAVINQEVKARAAIIEAEQGYRPGRKQTKEIKELVTESLMGKAFTVARDIRVWIDPANHWLVIDSASQSQTEEVLSAIGKSTHPYPVEPLRLTHSTAQLMTSWLMSGEVPDGFSIDPESHWQSQSGVVKYAKHAVSDDDIKKRIDGGYQCVRLALTWRDKISFVLTAEADIKRVQALDILEERAKADGGLTDQERLDADFVLMASEVANLLGELMAALGEVRE